MKFSEYAEKTAEEVLKDLKTSEKGLSEKEAENRFKTYGKNETNSKNGGAAEIFLRQFKSPFFYLLFIAAFVSFFIGEKTDAFLILFFVFINVALGFTQEYKAESAVSLLKKYIPSKTRVLRDGDEKVVEKQFLTPGDVVLLEAGNIAPADLRIVKANNLVVDESVLSGESVPVSKISSRLEKKAKEIFEAKNIIFAGAAIVSGEAEGVVIGTGKDTVIGGITKMVSEIQRESVYEKDLISFSRLILRIVIMTIALVFIANLIIKGNENIFDFLIFSIALIVSVIPEALPLVATFALSKGSLKMSKENVVVKRLSAVEDMGNIEILCSDKTGTLTENKLSLEKISSPSEEKFFLYALLSSPYMIEEVESGKNSFDAAIFEKAPDAVRKSLKDFKVVSEIPFDPFRARNTIILEEPSGKKILISKGAPETILNLSLKCEGGTEKEAVRKKIEEEGAKGRRALALAYKEIGAADGAPALAPDIEKDLIFLGYFSFRDPLKKTTKEAIQLAKDLGVKIKILTGDSGEVAGAVAKEVGLIDDSRKVILGERLNSLSEEKLKKVCEEFSVFARVSPAAKFKIVETLQKKFEVGFLGEGINDVPSLKLANVGIAVYGASDVSREAADIILLNKDLRVIVAGIKEGRNIFSNINKYIKCTLASNFGNFYSIAVISLFIPFLPMLPAQILLVNLLSDFPLIAVASDSVDAKELKKPKLYQLKKMMPLIVSLALVSTFFDFVFFGIFRRINPDALQTLWFIESILTEIALIFIVRSQYFFLKAKRPALILTAFSFLALFATLALPFADLGKNFFKFAPPSFLNLVIVLSLVLNYFIISEIVKLIYFKKNSSDFAE